MRFNAILDSKRLRAPSFSARQSRYAFTVIACAEIVLLTLFLLLFIQLKDLFDPALLLSVMLVLFGAFTFAFTRSLSIAQSVLFISALLLEFMLYSSLPAYPLYSSQGLKLTSSDVMPYVFALADLLLLYWILTRGLGMASDEEMTAPSGDLSAEFPDPDFVERTRK